MNAVLADNFRYDFFLSLKKLLFRVSNPFNRFIVIISLYQHTNIKKNVLYINIANHMRNKKDSF